MAAKDTPDSTDDMSIDELSAAIDAHMSEIDKPKPKKKSATLKPSTKNEPTPAAKKKEEPKEEPKEDEGHTKIAVKHAYVSKKDEKSSVAQPEKEKSQITHTSNVKLKPISKSDEEEEKSATKAKSNKDTVDVVVKTPVKPKEPKEDTQKVESPPAEPAEEKPVKEEPKEPEEKPEPKPEPKEPVETVEKPVIKAEAPKAAPVVQRTNTTDELNAQIPAAKLPREDSEPTESETLKTFDTKQYHIPIKASHHHRRGGTFKVFIAVMAVILATIYVLNELELIDLAALLAP